MDCSGLIYQSFLKYGKEIPRTTKQLSGYGQKIKLKNTQIGDLLFFKTSKKWGGINHVGLVTNIDGKYIEFIHSTTSRGVIVSKINEKYWAQAYKFARRIL
jgi:cell wall-associated NlpC family hydrolase